jgi:hypothetical protein
MDQQVLERLKAAAKALKGAYRSSKQAAEHDVSRWRWATGRYYALPPYQQERVRLPRGKPLASEPKSPKNVFAFGFDERNRLVLTRAYGADGKPGLEEFTSYADDTSTTRTYLNGGQRPGKLVEMTYERGQPREMYEYGSGGDHAHETYEYDGGRLSAIRVEQFNALMKKSFSHQYEFTYDKAGHGEATRVDASGTRQAAFEVDAKADG